MICNKHNNRKFQVTNQEFHLLLKKIDDIQVMRKTHNKHIIKVES